MLLTICLFFFSSRRRHTRYIGDWSSDVYSSDLLGMKLWLVTTHFGERSLEGLAVSGAERLDGPVLLRLERPNLPLALHDEPKSDGLHPSRRKPRLDAVPENRTGLVPDQTVQDASRLLSVDLEVVDLLRLTERLLDGGFGDLVEQ